MDNIQTAIDQHVMWRDLLIDALEKGVLVDQRKVADHHTCCLGKMLEAAEAEFSENVLCRRIYTLHVKFHMVASEIVDHYVIDEHINTDIAHKCRMISDRLVECLRELQESSRCNHNK